MELNGIIYYIRNKINNKHYIGQSITQFNERYKGNWIKYTHNYLLRMETAEFGVAAFEVKILKNNIKTIEDLNLLEEKYANDFNCYHPNGYNLAQCGNNKLMHETTKKKLQERHSRKTPLKLKRVSNGEIVEIFSLTNFCKENKLNRGNLIKMIYDYKYGKNHLESQGFCLPETTTEQLNSIQRNKYIYRPIELKNPNGEIIKIDCVRAFCKKEGFRRKYLSSLLNGNVGSLFGWTLPETTPRKERSKYYNLIFKLKDRYITIKYLIDYCKLNNLDYSSMVKVVKGKIPFHKGHFFVSKNLIEN